MNKIKRVQPLPCGRLFVEMADGRCGEFDVKPYMRSVFFSALMDETYFKQVRLVFRGIGWPNGQDLGPDTIADELVETETAA
ncbi:MAG: DUF2442 domain-containing protein [Sulfuricellaceae bacterium]|nr:DUF2442 domain-containing protein [Sulfuricellaceae bacterium]